MRNPIGPAAAARPRLPGERHPQRPGPDRRSCPGCCRKSLPVHAVVDVDVFLPGCPPSADLIYSALDELLAGRMPDTAAPARFGA